MNYQNVYASTLTFNFFCTMIIFITTLNFETKQLNAINVFLMSKIMKKYIVIYLMIINYLTKL